MIYLINKYHGYSFGRMKVFLLLKFAVAKILFMTISYL